MALATALGVGPVQWFSRSGVSGQTPTPFFVSMRRTSKCEDSSEINEHHFEYITVSRLLCCQPPELAEAVEKEVIGYEGYEEFSLGYLFLPLDQRRSLIWKVDIIGCHSNVIS